MIIFDTLKLASDNKSLTIKAHIPDDDKMSSFYIDSLIINGAYTSDSYNATTPLESKVLYTVSPTEEKKLGYGFADTTCPVISSNNFQVYKISYSVNNGDWVSINLDERGSEISSYLTEQITNAGGTGGALYYVDQYSDYIFNATNVAGDTRIIFSTLENVELDDTMYIEGVASKNKVIFSDGQDAVTITSKPREIELVITTDDLASAQASDTTILANWMAKKEATGTNDWSKCLFIVWIKEGHGDITQLASLSCTESRDYYCGIVMDMSPIWDKGYSYLSELSQDCSIPNGFTDFALNVNALNLYIDNGDITSAANLYSKLISSSGTSITSNCGCHGRISV